MKRKIFAVMAIASVAFVSCNKDELDSTELGSATISGNVWADMDLTQAGVEGVSGMQVKVEVNTQDWDQQPVPGYNYDQKVYTTMTDAAGDYTLTIPATDDGYTITIEFEDLYTDRTTSNGTEAVVVTRGNISKFIYSGASISTVDEATVSPWNTTTYGSATVTGTIWLQPDMAFWDGQDAPVELTSAVASTYGFTQPQIMWKYDAGDEPYNITDQAIRYIDYDGATGMYSFTVPTESPDLNDVYVYWGVNDFNGNGRISNTMGTADSTVAGYYAAGQIWTNGAWLWDGYIYNGDFTMNFNQF